MNIAVIGSREFNDYHLLETTVDAFLKERACEEITIVSGGARGADSLAEQYARNRRLPLIIKRADWSSYGKKAGYLRNVEMANIADVCIGFIVNFSPGASMMINLCKERNIETIVIRR